MPSRQEFQKLVVAKCNSEAISTPKAYEIIEIMILQRFGRRKYKSYKVYRMVNYNALVKERSAVAEKKHVIGCLYDLCHKHKDGEISTIEMVERIKPFVIKK